MAFLDHVVQNPDRYTITNNNDGTYTIVPTWVNNPAEVIQQGTTVDSATLGEFDNKIGILNKAKTNTFYVENYPLIIPETDDTERIKRAITACGVKNKLVFSPNVEYVVNTKIVVLDGQTWWGYGAKIRTTSDWNHVIEINTINDVSILGIRIEGINLSSSNGQLIYVKTGKNILIKDCYVSKSGENGIHLSQSCTECKVLNNTAKDNNKFGISLNGSSNNLVQGNTCTGNGAGFTGGGISIFYDTTNILDCANNVIANNDCNFNVGAGVYLYRGKFNTIQGNNCNNNGNGNAHSGIGLQGFGSDYNSVSGNTCVNNREHGIVVQGTNLTNYASGITITGNTCRGNGYSGVAFGKGIYIASYIKNLTISGNTCADSRQSGIEVAAYCSNVAITGNICTDNGKATSTRWTATKSYLQFAYVYVPSTGRIYQATTQSGTSGSTEPVWPTTIGATVTDGTVTWEDKGACSMSGIRIYDTSTEGTQGCSYISIANNICTDSQTNKTQGYGVSLEKTTAAITNAIITGNALSGNAISSYLDNGTGTIIPTGTNIV